MIFHEGRGHRDALQGKIKRWAISKNERVELEEGGELYLNQTEGGKSKKTRVGKKTAATSPAWGPIIRERHSNQLKMIVLGTILLNNGILWGWLDVRPLRGVRVWRGMLQNELNTETMVNLTS